MASQWLQTLKNKLRGLDDQRDNLQEPTRLRHKGVQADQEANDIY